MTFPKQSDVDIPLLQALESTGGSAKPKNIYAIVATYFPQLTDEDLEQRLESYPSTRKWWNLVQWVRQRLVESGDIDGSIKGVWAITDKGRSRLSASPITTMTSDHEPSLGPAPGAAITEVTLRDLANQSRDEAKSRLIFELRQLSPQAFELFCKELLQQLGYKNVEVTKRSGDGGIDGFGDFRQGAVSIKSAFQAKRWTDTAVGRPEIDKLRGAIQGDYDHGVFITTSRFSKDAEAASYKKGAISVLLLDGQAVAEIMLERGIGVRREPVYLYEVATDFFEFDSELA